MGDVMSVPVGGGPPTVLASGLPGPSSVAVDGKSVYWIAALLQGASAVMKLPAGGGTPVTLVSNETPIASLAVDATSVYWTDSVGGANAYPGHALGGRVSRMPSGGGAEQVLVDGSPLAPGGVAVDATSAYWLGSPGSPTNFTNVLQKVPLHGGAAVTLATYQAWGAGPAVAAVPLPVVAGQTARNVYWIAQPPCPSCTRPSSQPPSNLLSVPATGGSTSTLTTGANGVAVDSNTLYWTTGGTVMSLPTSGGTPITLANVGGGAGIAVDAASVYWIGPSAIMRLTPK